ncbi:hypothetical protein [Rhodovulum strictum]|uniref:Uncharacterized protein n=1 Tax=Rhodovulum strictum TaxID=58314 RepID=A0A844BML6_9RHOB|nr:hypothetical protein [Rhodovulum strictum]MRH22975.1 hypothetical protein [Rhodovulum strictum]
MNKFIFAVLGAACCAMPATANEILPSTKSEMTQIASGETKAVMAHGICRQITNNNANPVMIPHRTAKEWSAEENSFLASARPGLIMQNCPPQPPTEDCFFWVSGVITDDEYEPFLFNKLGDTSNNYLFNPRYSPAG